MKLKPWVLPTPPIITEAMTDCIRRVRRTNAHRIAPPRSMQPHAERSPLSLWYFQWGKSPGDIKLPCNIVGVPAPTLPQGNPRAQPLEILLWQRRRERLSTTSGQFLTDQVLSYRVCTAISNRVFALMQDPCCCHSLLRELTWVQICLTWANTPKWSLKPWKWVCLT